jgi:hypothetical protein
MENPAPGSTVSQVMPEVTAPLTYDSRLARRAAWARVIVFGLALVGTVLIGHVLTLPRFSLCTFQTLFGRPCPGCGMTRSIAHLARGDVLASLRLHPLGLPLLVTAVLGFVGGLLHLLRGRDPFWEFVERRGTWLAVGLLVSMIGLWVLRGFVVTDWSPDPVGQPTMMTPPFGIGR